MKSVSFLTSRKKNEKISKLQLYEDPSNFIVANDALKGINQLIIQRLCVKQAQILATKIKVMNYHGLFENQNVSLSKIQSRSEKIFW
jgi:hypothetical protein